MYYDVPITVAAKLPTRERRQENADHCGHRGSGRGPFSLAFYQLRFPDSSRVQHLSLFGTPGIKRMRSTEKCYTILCGLFPIPWFLFFSLSGLYKHKDLNYPPAFSPLASPCLDAGETSWIEYLHKQTLQHCLLGARTANGCILFSAPTLLSFPSQVLLYENSGIGTQRSQTAWSHLHHSQKMWTVLRHPQSC